MVRLALLGSGFRDELWNQSAPSTIIPSAYTV